MSCIPNCVVDLQKAIACGSGKRAVNEILDCCESTGFLSLKNTLISMSFSEVGVANPGLCGELIRYLDHHKLTRERLAQAAYGLAKAKKSRLNERVRIHRL